MSVSDEGPVNGTHDAALAALEAHQAVRSWADVSWLPHSSSADRQSVEIQHARSLRRVVAALDAAAGIAGNEISRRQASPSCRIEDQDCEACQ